MFGAVGLADQVRMVPSQKRAPLDFQFEFPVGANMIAASHWRRSAVGILGVSCGSVFIQSSRYHWFSGGRAKIHRVGA